MRTDPPEVEALNAVFAVMKRRAARVSKPGHWRVFRDGDRVVFEPVCAANDPEPPPPMAPLIA